jgi:hypothetical protein
MQAITMPAPNTVHSQLERILTSVPFSKSNRSQQFLRYVVGNSLEELNESLKEYAIAIHVFDRDTSYDPAVDATVRVEAGRLRARLREYYADSGRNDPLVIEIPKGAYRAHFTERSSLGERRQPLIESADAGTKRASKTFPIPDKHQNVGYKGAYIGLAATVVFAAIIGGAMFLGDRIAHGVFSQGR